MKTKNLNIAVLILFILSCLAGVYLILQGEINKKSAKSEFKIINLKKLQKSDNVAVIKITGVISASYESNVFGLDNIELVMERLKELEKMDNIKTIIIRINSPGGSVGTVQEIYSEILKLKANGKKIVASIADVGASGGYYIAAACDKIVANPGSMTGSIGVIMQIGNVEELFKKIGVKVVSVKSGKYKDMGSPTKAFSEEEKKIFQSLIDDAYEQFVDDVVKGRSLDRRFVMNIADGRVFTGRQALSSKMIDSLGGLNEAIKIGADLSGIKEEDVLLYEPSQNLKHIMSLINNKISNIDFLSSLGKKEEPKIKLQYIME